MVYEKDIVAMNLEQDLSVVQANELVRSKQDDLTLLEAKLVRLAIGQVLKSDTDLQIYSCRIIELANYLGIAKQYLYDEVQGLGVSLMKKSIFITDKSKKKKNGEYDYKIFHWIELFEYKDGIITIELSKSLRPYLIGLDKLFTMYGYSAILDLPTNNSIRLYELIASYQNMIVDGSNELRFSIDELRKYFNCKDKYANTVDFIKRIIDSSVKAIQLNGSMRITYTLEREGRKFTHIVFKIHPFSDLKYNEMLEQLKESNK